VCRWPAQDLKRRFRFLGGLCDYSSRNSQDARLDSGFAGLVKQPLYLRRIGAIFGIIV
jgi:hypothetical protein